MPLKPLKKQGHNYQITYLRVSCLRRGLHSLISSAVLSAPGWTLCRNAKGDQIAGIMPAVWDSVPANVAVPAFYKSLLFCLLLKLLFMIKNGGGSFVMRGFKIFWDILYRHIFYYMLYRHILYRHNFETYYTDCIIYRVVDIKAVCRTWGSSQKQAVSTLSRHSWEETGS